MAKEIRRRHAGTGQRYVFSIKSDNRQCHEESTQPDFLDRFRALVEKKRKSKDLDEKRDEGNGQPADRTRF